MKETKNNILIISPHPDDESIGCAGTICQHISAGDCVNVIFLTSGEKGRKGKAEDETIALREQEAADAAKVLGIHKIEFWKQPDGALQKTPALIQLLTQYIQKENISRIYVPHDMEQHPDHQAANALLCDTLKNLTNQTPCVWMYEVWTPLQEMDHIIDISDFVALKKKAIQAHKCQCDILKFDEAILGLNRYRGEMHSWPGGDYAEIFKEMKLK